MKLSTILLLLLFEKKKVNVTIKNVTEDYYGEVTVIHYHQVRQPFFLTYGKWLKLPPLDYF